ncbi:MAG: hypothetical protein A2078_09945 [Nitrospirae bacterium GWC2_57_9]|nr:MAG: hypothetical protein A2078_09945 [Nitrospirae bacterium GWC2_57_9]
MAERKNRKRPPEVADLEKYRSKRDFKRTREPEGGIPAPSPAPLFVVQQHAARRLHYDLRLEAEGVLKSWAVPRGPSYDPGEKRLAVHVEDHPLEYADFEGIIPENEYGAGTVMVWDRGTWTPLGDWKKGLHEGKLTFRLEGRKLKGIWKLIRIRERVQEEFDEPPRDNWLLIKASDEETKGLRGLEVTAQEPLSVKTGRSMEQITAQKNAYWKGSREASPRKDQAPKPAPPPPRGTKAPWPESFFPQLATLVTRLPEGGPWVSEIKFDGYRLIARISQGRVTLVTRRGQDWTGKFTPLVRELSRLPVRNAILDGEVVVMNPDGTTNFQKLQNILRSANEKGLVYFVFDLPYYEDHDLTGLPLTERKKVLRELLTMYRERVPSVRYSEHVDQSGARVLRAACENSFEGIIAKRGDSPYVQKRTRYWVKKKCINRQEFVVGGYTAPKGTRSLFGSLVLGYYNEKRQLVYCGNVGTGFNEDSIKLVHERLKQLEQNASPFAPPLEDARNRDVRYVAPRLVAEVEFSDWTEGGHLRHPSFVGLREDKKPEEIGIEKETPPPGDEEKDQRPLSLPLVKGRDKEGLVREGVEELIIPIKLTNPDKVLYPETGVTKEELARYYLRVGGVMLPEAANRPLVLVRCPEGLSEDMRRNCFFQKHLRDDIPEGVRTTPIEEKGQVGLYPVVDDITGILSLAQFGVLEIHMLGCRADDVEHPDRMIFDLDPAPDVSKGRLIEATFFIRDFLKKNGMEPHLKLTGGKGIHIVVPLRPGMNWDELKTVSRAIALEMVRTRPEWFVATVTKRKRTGKILVDYLRNSLGASTIVPYSTRAKPGAPIAIPIDDSDLNEELLAEPVTLRNAVEWMKVLRREPSENS